MELKQNATGLLGSATTSLKSAGETIFKSLGATATETAADLGGLESCTGKMTASKLESYTASSKSIADQTVSPSLESKAVKEKTKTGVNIKKYPANIGTEMYPHFVTFYINVNSKSKIATRGQGAKDFNGKVVNYTTTDIHEKKSSSQVRDIVDDKSKLNGIVPGIYSSSYKRLNTSISLPLPSEIVSEYGADYGTISSGGIAGSIFHALAEGKDFSSIGAGAIKDIIQSAPGQVIKTAAVTAAGVGGGFLGGGIGASAAATMTAANIDAKNINALANKAGGVAMNERLEQTFKQINFRQFSFNYTFAPRDKTETDEIQNIIKLFKYHMHPEVNEDDNGAFLIMPDEFDIEFRFNTIENKYLHKIATCVLTNISVNNAPGGNFVSFRDGAPAIISLQLRFTETTPLVRGMVDTGY